MAENTELNLFVSEDARHATLKVGGQSLTMDVGGLETLLATLLQLRGVMQPPVEISDPLPGQTIRVLPAVRWYIEPTPEGAARVMLLNPGAGWLSIDLFGDQRARFAKLVMKTDLPGKRPKPN
ncbi:MAG: hypothetical protein ACRYGM_29455 [Janthinobacterium lividum]